MNSSFQELRSRHVVMRDGTKGGAALARLMLAAFIIAMLLVLAWGWLPGPDDTFTGTDGSVEFPRLAVIAGLAATAVFFAGVAWHIARARTIRPLLAVVGIAVADAVLAMTLFAQYDLARGIRELAPSFTSSAIQSHADVLLALGVTALMTTAAFATAVVIGGRVARFVATIAAAIAPLAVLVALVSIGSSAHPRLVSVDPATATSGPVVHVEPGTSAGSLGSVVLQLGGLIAVACFGLLAVLDVRELMHDKAGSESALVRMTESWARVTSVISGAILALLFVFGRAGMLPGADDVLPAFVKTGRESWILAAIFAVTAILILRSGERRPFTRRGTLVPLVSLGLVLFSGGIVLAVARVIQILISPLVDRGWLFDFVTNRLPTWSLWAQDWSNVFVPIAAGVVGLALLVRGERSDRVVFLLATTVISAVPGLLYILDHRNIDAGLSKFSPATPDQVMIVAAFLIIAATLIRRDLLGPVRSMQLVLGVALVTVVASLVSGAVGNRFFHFGLVAPLAVTLVLSTSQIRARPPRGVHRTAFAAILLLITAAGLMCALLGPEQINNGALLAFLFLAAPLLLVELLRYSDEPAEEFVVPTRRAPVWIVAPAVALAGILAVVAPLSTSAADAERPFTLEVELRDRWKGEQLVRPDGGEQVLLTFGTAQVIALDAPSFNKACSVEVLSSIGNIASELERAPDVAGLPTVSTTLDDGTQLLCGLRDANGGVQFVLAAFTDEESGELLSQLYAISFGA